MGVDVSDLIGMKYKPHGRGDGGYDCYGLTLEVERRFGNIMPDFEYEDTDGKIDTEAAEILRRGNARQINTFVPGAIILLQNVQGMKTHIGVYLEDGMFIHSHVKKNVCIDTINAYRHCISGVYIWQGK